MSEITDGQGKPMMVPSLHSNGSGFKSLLKQVVDASRAVRSAEEALRAAWPNGRDYYTQGPEALPQAIRQWEEMAGDLGRTRLRLDEIANGLWDAKEGRE